MVRWWRQCCRCCWTDDKSPIVDDSSALIRETETAFYVPARRHSTINKDSYVRTQPGEVVYADSGSSSGDEDSPRRRGRCWSEITPRDVATVLHNNSVEKVEEKQSRLPEIPEGIEEGGSEVTPPVIPPPDEVAGVIYFSASYNEQEQKLRVYVSRVEGLPRIRCANDEKLPVTFVRISLTHSRKHFRLTRTGKGQDPSFLEEHIIHTNRSSAQCAVRLSVMENEKEGRHDALGHCLLALNCLTDKKQMYSFPLLPTTMLDQSPLGQVQIGLFYSYRQSRLSVHVIKARHLHTDRNAILGRVDVFAKVTLLCGGAKVVTGRSVPLSLCPDPPFDHRSHFVLPPAFLPDASVRVCVVARGKLGRALNLGRVALGPHTHAGSGQETHWGRMLNDERPVVQWRNLYL